MPGNFWPSWYFSHRFKFIQPVNKGDLKRHLFQRALCDQEGRVYVLKSNRTVKRLLNAIIVKNEIVLPGFGSLELRVQLNFYRPNHPKHVYQFRHWKSVPNFALPPYESVLRTPKIPKRSVLKVCYNRPLCHVGSLELRFTKSNYLKWWITKISVI